VGVIAPTACQEKAMGKSAKNAGTMRIDLLILIKMPVLQQLFKLNDGVIGFWCITGAAAALGGSDRGALWGSA